MCVCLGWYGQWNVLVCLILNVSYVLGQSRLSVVKRTAKLILLLFGKDGRCQVESEFWLSPHSFEVGKNCVIVQRWRQSFPSSFSTDIFLRQIWVKVLEFSLPLYNCFYRIAVKEVIIDFLAGTMRKEVVLGSLENTFWEGRLCKQLEEYRLWSPMIWVWILTLILGRLLSAFL